MPRNRHRRDGIVPIGPKLKTREYEYWTDRYINAGRYTLPMKNSQPTGNRRGQQSRQEILDAASRVMSAYGYAGTSMSALVEATGIPKSAIYHHFGSKAGLLAEVMARGAQGFFEAMRDAHRDPPQGGTPRERLGWYLQRTGAVSVHHENFLRLLMVMVMTSEATDAPEAMEIVATVRNEGRDYMRQMIRAAFSTEGEAIAAAVADRFAHFGMVGFDGAFVSLQSRDDCSMATYMSQLADALGSMGQAYADALRDASAAPARKRAAKSGKPAAPAQDKARRPRS
ncbi:TetR/AcrR family transcriptional regulator [Burkholderia multivorans]|uniref:TetR/AcrR family transcriptional regulator n=2 Tax=Burkholderia multivorans TaxID=87883 RepID=UPI0020192ED0|nr:TetR/AcrR family transcriptional regulator [Burkholderia multivorans]MCO1463105.1 TetR/AcrR family transcriptional regulator [Burkholderia multivorans]UQN72445.1 TetR/AcrR family transcriptional regulator [Burkholderia multivorans]UQN78180.1 TetR/AcrR family transcriptional regulator [Burkholderia multivorans]